MSETEPSGALPLRVAVIGTSLWTPGVLDSGAADLRALHGADTNAELSSPPIAMASSRQLRGTSLLTRMQVHVAESACARAGADPAAVAAVFGSAYGEIDIALLQLRMMCEGDGIVSPARFKNSVHNTGSGVFSIAAGNQGFATAIAGGAHTVGDCLLEAFGLLADGLGPVALALAEESLPAPLATFRAYAPLAVGLVLVAAPDGSEASERAPILDDLRWEPHPEEATSPVEPPLFEPALPPRFAANPCAPALSLLLALRRDDSAPIRVTLGDALGARYTVRVQGGRARDHGSRR
ncbi:MAG: beta-ketoacyl synthase chain length factor [Myxococcales bacterium]|nr:beta-ketoacyl synthase chain length factor [Myxococcales bacterium]